MKDMTVFTGTEPGHPEKISLESLNTGNNISNILSEGIILQTFLSL